MNGHTPPIVRHRISIRTFDPPTAQGRGGHGRADFKILLLKLDHIGDFLTALDAFRILRHAFAGAEITLICLPAVVALAASTGLFDIVKGFSALPDSTQMGKIPRMDREDRIARFKELLAEPYFLAADFKHDPFDRFGLDHVDARYRAAFAAHYQKGLDIVIPTMEWDAPSVTVGEGKNLPPHAEVRLTLLAHAIVESLLEKPLDADLFHPADDLVEQPAYRALEAETRMKIGLSVAAGSELRQWQGDYWTTLLQKLAQTHDAIFILFGGDNDKAATAALTAQLAPGSFVDLTGVLPLNHLPAYMNLLDAYIGCDTGLTHLAGNLGVPTVNIFAGISNVSVWRARGPRVKTVYAEVICAPCHLRFKKDCPNNNVCMGALVPDIVYACFEQVVTA